MHAWHVAFGDPYDLKLKRATVKRGRRTAEASGK